MTTNSMYAFQQSASNIYDAPPNGGNRVSVWSTLPTAAAVYRGVPMRTEGSTGVADKYTIPLKDIADSYATFYPLLSRTSNDVLSGTRVNVLASSGNTTMTQAMSGSVMLLDGATVAYTLPAITADNIGMNFRFVTTVAATAQTITAQAGDLLTGGVLAQSTTAGGADAFSPDVSDDLIITMNGTTQGGVVGSSWLLIAVSATRWWCSGWTIGSGTLATNFS